MSRRAANLSLPSRYRHEFFEVGLVVVCKDHFAADVHFITSVRQPIKTLWCDRWLCDFALLCRVQVIGFVGHLKVHISIPTLVLVIPELLPLRHWIAKDLFHRHISRFWLILLTDDCLRAEEALWGHLPIRYHTWPLQLLFAVLQRRYYRVYSLNCFDVCFVVCLIFLHLIKSPSMVRRRHSLNAQANSKRVFGCPQSLVPASFASLNADR